MSIFKQIETSCSKCPCKHKVVMYRSINVKENPELKELVRSGELFMWKCPDCDTVNLLSYETLYHDPDKKLMVWLIPSGSLEERKAEMAAIRTTVAAMGDYTLRLVSNVGELIEKLLIFDSGLDDVVVELCKKVTSLETGNGENAPLKASALKFFRLERSEDKSSSSITFSFPKDGAMTGCAIGFNVYEDCLGIIERNPSLKPDKNDGFARVDAEWLSSRIG